MLRGLSRPPTTTAHPSHCSTRLSRIPLTASHSAARLFPTNQSAHAGATPCRLSRIGHAQPSPDKYRSSTVSSSPPSRRCGALVWPATISAYAAPRSRPVTYAMRGPALSGRTCVRKAGGSSSSTTARPRNRLSRCTASGTSSTRSSAAASSRVKPAASALWAMT